jgi:hypothetical protein
MYQYIIKRYIIRREEDCVDYICVEWKQGDWEYKHSTDERVIATTFQCLKSAHDAMNFLYIQVAKEQQAEPGDSPIVFFRVVPLK